MCKALGGSMWHTLLNNWKEFLYSAYLIRVLSIYMKNTMLEILKVGKAERPMVAVFKIHWRLI
jgi:hypothetical protein